MPLLILFLTGYNDAIPGYGWARAWQPVHAVFLDNILLLLYVAMLGLPRRIPWRSDALVFTGLIALLGILGITSAAFNPTRVEDIGQALRLMLLSVYTLYAIQWARTRGSTFLLRAYLTGLALAGAINIYISFAYPYLRVAMLPALYARNGTGGPLGLGVVLGAWMFTMRKTRADGFIAVAASLVGITAAAISFSKTSMLIASCGVIAWAFVLAHGVAKRQVNAAIAVAALIFLGGYVANNQSEQVSDFLNSFKYSLGIKFAGAALTVNDAASTQWRYQYFWGVAEIVSAHPLTGVGSSGFYDAIIKTSPFQAGMMSEEDPEARTQGGANPHNSFLYYASANGVPGLAVVLALYLGFLAVSWRALGDTSVRETAIWCCMALAYLLYGMTLPSLFSTMVLYLPAAVAISIGATERSSRRIASRLRHLPATVPTAV